MPTATEVYREHFEMALDRSRKFGFKVPSVGPTSAKALFDDAHDETAKAIVDEVCKFYQANDLVGACLPVSHFMRKVVSNVVGTTAMFTVGSVTYLGKTTFTFTDSDLGSWIAYGLPAPAEGVHAWLTMPTMEIVDFTWMYTMKAVVPHTIPGDPLPIFASPERLGLTYTPLLVAEDFVERVRAIKYTNQPPGAGWRSA